MPFFPGCRKAPADLGSKILAKLQRPLPHGLMADQDAPGGEHLLNHAQAQGKSKIQTHGMSDDFRRETMAGLARRTCRGHTSSVPESHQSEVNLTVPGRV